MRRGDSIYVVNTRTPAGHCLTSWIVYGTNGRTVDLYSPTSGRLSSIATRTLEQWLQDGSIRLKGKDT
jgi:hypothetical protein